jgi:hypothetical protein
VISISIHLPGSIFRREGDIASTQNLLISFKPIICMLNYSHVINYVIELKLDVFVFVSIFSDTLTCNIPFEDMSGKLSSSNYMRDLNQLTNRTTALCFLYLNWPIGQQLYVFSTSIDQSDNNSMFSLPQLTNRTTALCFLYLKIW